MRVSELRSPVRQEVHNQIGSLRIIRKEVDGKIVWPSHALGHREVLRAHGRTLTRIEGHRTDGQFGRSTALQNFNVRLLLETQDAIAFIGDDDRD